MRTHELEGRKREKWVGELRNVAHHKRGLTSWRGESGRSGLVSSETWHIASEDSLEGRKREERVGELRNVARCKQGLTDRRVGGGRRPVMRLETWHIRGLTRWRAGKGGRGRREERVSELGNAARHKRELTHWREERGRSGPVSLEMWHIANANERGLTCWRRGRGRSEVVALEIRNIANKDSPT